MPQQTPERDPATLSREELVREVIARRQAAAQPPAQEPPDDLAARRLLHDLQVHQLELEQQNRLLREAQQGLETSRARYADLFDFAPIGYCTFDARGSIRELNLTGAAFFGAPREQLIGRPLVALVSPRSRTAFHTHLARACENGGAAVEVEFAVRGTTAVAQLICAPNLTADGRRDGCRAAFIDITAFKELEARLRFLSNVGELAASPMEYRGTLSAIAHLAVPFLADVCLVDVLDEDGRLYRVESAFAEAENEARWASKLSEARPSLPLGPEARVVQSRQPLLYEDLKAADGGFAAAGAGSMMVVPLLARGRTLGTMTFATSEPRRHYGALDLTLAEETSRRAAMALDNARLLALQRRDTRFREDLLSIVSHDLKNPLSIILLVATRLIGAASMPGAAEPRHVKDLRRIKSAAERMVSLIQSLLDAASIEAGRLSIERGRVAVEALVTEAIEAFQPLATSNGVVLGAHVDGALPDVYADPARIHQVLANLIGNAIKFTPSQGRVTVTAAPCPEGVMLCVADTGSGIPKDELEHLFDRFWQSRRGASAGTGLGLFIVKGIVESHGGKVWVESEPGVGTRFGFNLNSAPPGAVAAEPARAAEALAAERLAQTAELERVGPRRPTPEEERQYALKGLRIARDLARRAMRLQPAVLSLVAHELRSPLTALLLELGRIDRGAAKRADADLELTVRKMFVAVDRVTHAIDAMLLEALIESGELKPLSRPFDASGLARDVVDQLSGPAGLKGLALMLATGPGELVFEGDEQLTRTVLSNLVDNAVKFTERGQVAVEVHRRDAALELQVSDTGPGIPDTERERIFAPFTQLGRPEQKHVPGLGLGLSLVAGITCLLGGEVRVDSREHEGTTFTVLLPPSKAAAPGGPAWPSS